MIATISRDELKMKIDRGEQFLLVETLPAATYHHAHLPGAINLPPDQVTQLAPHFCRTKGLISWFTAPVPLEMLPRTRPVNWRRWVTRTSATTPKANKAGLTLGYLLRVSTNIDWFCTRLKECRSLKMANGLSIGIIIQFPKKCE